jgi:DNA/RNA endonuclease G (NUC1)
MLTTIIGFSQIKFKEPKLMIKHGDLTIWLDSDYNSFVTRHELKYVDFLKLDSGRDNKWHNEIYKGPYSKEYYLHSGYDLGHLTPSHITSYNDTLNYHSFSFYNQAPQIAQFNRGKWARLEKSVEDSIMKYKSNVTIITGVIYDNNNKIYMGKSKIKIPYSFYKILYIKKNKLTYVWVGSNNNGEIIVIKIKELNELLKSYKNILTFN